MYKLNFKKRVWIVKQYKKGVPISSIALTQKINERTAFKIIKRYHAYEWNGLKDHKTGRSETILNNNAVVLILDLRTRYGYGACRIEHLLKNKGFGISHRQIEKVLIRNDCVIPNVKKQKPRKWVRYELPNPHDLWHTDWSYDDPFTGNQLSVYIDDKTRLITSYGLFKRASAESTLALLHSGIADYGKPKAIMTDHGSQYYANHPNAEQEESIDHKRMAK